MYLLLFLQQHEIHDEYIRSSPLLFFKESWLVSVHESFILNLAGCHRWGIVPAASCLQRSRCCWVITALTSWEYTGMQDSVRCLYVPTSMWSRRDSQLPDDREVLVSWGVRVWVCVCEGMIWNVAKFLVLLSSHPHSCPLSFSFSFSLAFSLSLHLWLSLHSSPSPCVSVLTVSLVITRAAVCRLGLCLERCASHG